MFTGTFTHTPNLFGSGYIYFSYITDGILYWMIENRAGQMTQGVTIL